MTTSELLTNIINSRNSIRTALINKNYLENDSTALLSQLVEICNTIYDKNIVDEIFNNQSATYVKRITGEIEKHDIEGELTTSSISNKSTISNVIIGNNVTSIGNYAFEDCSNLTSITIPSSVTSIGERAFYHCLNLTSATISPSVTEIGMDMFADCTNLTSVTISPGVTEIGNSMFNGCSSLTSVVIPSSVTTIGNNAFAWCESLTSITFEGNPPTADITSFQNSNTNLIGYYLPENATAWESALDSDGKWNGITMQQLNTEN